MMVASRLVPARLGMVKLRIILGSGIPAPLNKTGKLGAIGRTGAKTGKMRKQIGANAWVASGPMCPMRLI